jgi:hypothetical protein
MLVTKEWNTLYRKTSLKDATFQRLPYRGWHEYHAEGEVPEVMRISKVVVPGAGSWLQDDAALFCRNGFSTEQHYWLLAVLQHI